MSRIGYARVSSLDQDLDGQVARLKAEGCAIIRSEKVSGGSREGREELATVLEFLRPGDELVVTRLDRLGRDTRDVLNLIHEAEQRGAFVTVLDPHVSTRGEMGHVVLTVLGMVAQMERRFIKERQREGIERAKVEGVYQGGQRRLDRERIKAMHDCGSGPAGRLRPATLILLGEHDGQHPHRYGRVGRIKRTEHQLQIVSIDLPEAARPANIDRAEVMLAERVVVRIKAGERADGCKNYGALSFGQGRDPGRQSPGHHARSAEAGR